MHDLFADFEKVTPDLWLANEEGWKEKLLNLPNWYQIPLINSNASHNLADGTLVRFRGMIQDMHNPEFYFEQFEVFNNATNEVKNKSGKYRDTSDVMENEKINYAQNLVSAQRQTMVVVSIPGLSEWAQEIENTQNHLKHLEEQPNSSKRLKECTKLKRSYEETEDADAMEVVDDSTNENNTKERKTNENETNNGNVVSREHLLNFPLPDVPSKSCIVKVYSENDDLKVNEMIEVVGFLSVDPTLSGEFLPETEELLAPQVESHAETLTHHPPPSLVPRVHAVHIKKLQHCNPLVTTFDQEAVLKEANTAREHLLKSLTELLLGDRLAAEYLICHLIAKVYLRQESLALGQCCLNISHVPATHPQYARQLYDMVKQFVTTSYYLPLTVDNMNTVTLLPKKDYECNRLTSGILQLPAGAHLLVDETRMREGTLQDAGVRNVAALAHLIQQQRVEYDFKYYKMEFDSDVSVLVMSEGKSLLPSDYHLPLKPEESSLAIFDAIVEAATYYLKDDIMNTIRTYLTNLKMVKYTINDNLQFVEDDFIEMRSNSDSENPVTADDLHRLLVLARLVSLSRGQHTLHKDCWDAAKNMEAERLQRVKNRVRIQESAKQAVEEAKERLQKLVTGPIKSIGLELENSPAYLHSRAVTAGFQEFIEAISLCSVIETKEIITYSEVVKQLTYVVKNSEEEEEGRTIKTLLPQNDYMLGLADLTGELMRRAINSISRGESEHCFHSCQVVRDLYTGYLGLFGIGKELARKMSTTRANVAKVEQAVYALRVRGGEAPPTLLLLAPPPRDWENNHTQSDDEGFYM